MDYFIPTGTYWIGIETFDTGWLQIDNFGSDRLGDNASNIPEPDHAAILVASVCIFLCCFKRKRY